MTLDDPNAGYLSDIGFPVHALGPTRTTYGFNAKLLPWLRANRERFDGVVVNGLWAVLRVCRVEGAPHGKTRLMWCLLMACSILYFRYAFPLKHIKKWIYWVPFEYRVLRDAYRVLFTSSAEKRLAEQSFSLFKWNPQVVPYGASGPQGDSEAQKRAFFLLCPAVEGKRFLLFLGRIHRKKGCDMLIDAFAKIAGSDPDLHLVMAGPRPTAVERKAAADR